MRTSKQLDRLIQDDHRFDSYEIERDNGVWLWCRTGYVCPSMECGTIHEDTVAEVLSMAKTVVPGDVIDGCTVPKK